MKKFLAWLLLAATLISLCGCAGEPAATVAATVPAETVPATEAPTETAAPAQQTEAPALEGSLFVKVSAITFSLVGDSEDIYLGVIPRELVAWESDDPSIVSVEQGVLTAAGVGTTTIRGTYEDRQVEITAGCLAQTQEELEALDDAILRQPRHLPPEVDLEEPCTYFDNAALVGDSISYFLMQWEAKTNYLGDMLFLARGGVSMNGFVHGFKNIYYKGKERMLEDAIASSGVERVYFLMGSNDISSRTQRPYLQDNWYILLDKIREQCPDIEVVILSSIPLYGNPHETSHNEMKFTEYNTRIADYNIWLREFAAENDCMFLDLNFYIRDHRDTMPEIYSQGSYHMNEAGCLNWMKILRYYAQFELEGGSLA